MKRTISIITAVCIMLSALTILPCAVFADESAKLYSYKVLSDGSVRITSYNGNEYDVVIPEEIDSKKVTQIDSFAFHYTDYSYREYGSTPIRQNIRTITVPKTVTKIYPSCFFRLSNLSNFYVDKENENYTAVKGVLFNKDKTVLISYPPARPDSLYKIPGTVKTIEYNAFDSSRYLNNVRISKNVTKIKGNAFMNCLGIDEIYVPETVKKIESNAFGCKRSYYSAWYDPKTLPPSYDWDCDPIEEYTTANKAFTLYGKKGSAAEKYCKTNILTNEYTNKTEKIRFKTVVKKKAVIKTKVKKNNLTVYAKNHHHATFYEYSITFGNTKNSYIYSTDESYLRNGYYVKTLKKLKKGTYKIKVRAILYIGGYTFKTPYSKTVKAEIK